MVWSFDPSCDAIEPDSAGPYSWRTEEGCVVPGDDARYINHSATPNLVTSPGLTPTVAARDIEAGEELTESYDYDLDWPSYAEMMK